MTNVKEFLNRALEYTKMINVLKNELKEKRKELGNINISYSEIKSNMINSLTEEKTIRIVELEEDIKSYEQKRDTAIKEIREVISMLDDEIEKKLLELKYIDGMKWWKIAKIFNYSERQMHRKYNKALEKIDKILKDVSQCH